jgi:hypothetical protein
MPLGMAYAATNYTLHQNIFDDANGGHSVVAVAYDATGATIATSAAVAFTLANTSTLSNGSASYNGNVTVTPACTTNCSGTISFTVVPSGTLPTYMAYTTNVFIDGQNVISDGACGATPCSGTETIDTRNYYDGSHLIRIEGALGVGGESHVFGWQQAITFQNGSGVAVATVASAHEIFLQPVGTYTLSATTYNGDGSTVSTPNYQFFSLNSAVATVNQTTGLVTAVGAAPNSVQIAIMPESIPGTFHISGNSTTLLPNSPATFQPAFAGDVLYITGGSGCNVGYNIWHSAGTASASSATAAGTVGSVCTYETGPTRFVWAFIHASNAIAHLSRGGGILGTYSPTASFWHASIFFNAQTFNTYPNWCADYNAAGYNTLEFELEYSLPASIAQGTWTTAQGAYTTAQQATAQGCNSYLHGIMDSWWRGDTEMYNTTRGPSVQGAGTWSIPPLTILMQTLANANTCTPTLTNKCFGSYVYTSRYDEFSTTWGTSAYFPNPISFTSGVTNIVCNGTTTCTVTWPGWSMSALGFAITGATTAGLNTPACPTTPGYYTATNISSTQFSFPSTAASGTYNNSTDPGLTIEPLAHGCHTPPGGGSATDFTRYNAFAQVMNQMTGSGVTGNRPIGTWTNPALTSPLATLSTGGNPNMADNTDQYINESSTVTLYKPSAEALYTLPGDIGDNFQRLFVPSFQDGKPSLMPNTPALSAFYTFAGYPCTVTSFTGNTITCSADHSIRNTLPNTTRVALSVMSTSGDNGNYKIISSPTSTTLTVYRGTVIVSTSTSAGTITFQNGDHYSGLIIQSLSSPTSQRWGMDDSANGCVIATHRGMTFTISGTGTAWDASGTYYYPLTNASDSPCTNNLQAAFFLIPVGTSTSGTATITPDNWAHRGLSDMGASPGAVYHYAAVNEAVILRMAGIRSYPVIGFDPQYFNWGTTGTASGVGAGAFSTAASSANSKYNNWTDFPNNAEQFGPYTGSIGNGAIGEWVQDWWAIGLANLQAEAKASWIFKPSLNSPDIGIGFECAARGDAGGNYVICQSFWNATTTMTIPVAAYVTSGVAFIQDYCTYLDCVVSSIAYTTSPQSITCAPGCTVHLRFPASNPTAEWSAPVISARLADVTNAASIVVQYAYTPFPMNAPTGQGQINSVSIGTGTGTIPVDLHIAPVQYRLIYLNSALTPIATSDIQTMAQIQ